MMMNDDRDAAAPFPDLQLAERHFPIDLRFPSDLRYIEQIVGVVARNCAELAFPSRVVNLQVPVALSEALSNAILYGNRHDSSKRVRLRARVDDRALVLEVADEGTGFDLDACTSDPTSEENIDREDGRGLFLMRRFMDRVERFNDGGNVVRLTLLRS
ncbi:MAG: ATP-binding protein [Gemmatimonadaceae bacterium]